MIETKVTVINELGLHARPAAQFVEKAKAYRSSITIKKDTSTANGKSILGIMGLGIGKGTTITIQVSGEDEQKASQELKELVETFQD
ncbi:HPr family phosphocarrier protein [Brevibacillus sp. SIMBA_040]|uniref:HPr family phosphocarrier protein n=1 Tax=unclassified Brevibacillus TaxID=2684853 RepID=UPI003979C488